MKKTVNKRLDWVDTLRGLAMFFVVCGHCLSSIKSTLRKYIYSFHLPLFFFISGIIFKDENLSTKEFLKKKTRNLVISYFILNIICFALVYLLKLDARSTYSIPKLLVGMFFSHEEVLLAPCPPSWFLLALFLTETIFYFLHKYAKNDFELGIAVCVCGLISYANNHMVPQIYAPWHLDTAFTGVVLYFCGYLLAKNMYKLDSFMKKKFTAFVTGGMLGVVGLACAYYNNRVSMHSNLYGSITLFYISCLSTIFGLIIFVRLFLKHSVLFKNIGKRTMFYIGYHVTVIDLLRLCYKNFTDGNLNRLLCAICATLVIYPFAYLAYKYVPILCGKTKLLSN